MGKTLKIVMVDDNTDFLFTMQTFLQKNGFEVHTAADGQKGIDLIKKERPDLILLDIMMPDIDGYEVCRRLKADNRNVDGVKIALGAIHSQLMSFLTR